MISVEKGVEERLERIGYEVRHYRKAIDYYASVSSLLHPHHPPASPRTWKDQSPRGYFPGAIFVFVLGQNLYIVV
jgi:hypothetical protein